MERAKKRKNECEREREFARISQTRYTFSSFVVTLNLNGSRNFRPRSTHILSKADVSRVVPRHDSSSLSFLLPFYCRIVLRKKTHRFYVPTLPRLTPGPTLDQRPAISGSIGPSIALSGRAFHLRQPPLFSRSSGGRERILRCTCEIRVPGGNHESPGRASFAPF